MQIINKFIWIFLQIVIIFVHLASSQNSVGFKARIFLSHRYPSFKNNSYPASSNHSVGQLDYFGNAQSEEIDPSGFIFNVRRFWTVVEIGIGTPPVTFNLMIDTGSQLTWVYHNKCTFCPSKSIVYDEISSATSRIITCNQNECDEDGDIITCYKNWDRCMYNMHYGDGKTSGGFLYFDTFTINSVEEETVQLEGVRFGAAYDAKFDYFREDIHGLFGLSRSPRSFISERGYKRFSYCIPSADVMQEWLFGSEGSDILFGDKALLDGSSTPMVPHPHYYVMNLEGISVKGKRLNLDPNLLKVNAVGGMILDTGTPVTRLPEKVFKAVETELKAVINPKPTTRINVNALCYDGGLAEINQYVPNITLHFKGLDLSIAPQSLFLSHPEVPCFCLSMDKVDGSFPNPILGGITQQNINIGLDLEGNKIHMMPMKCEPVN